jgi:twitching motility protein PilT
MVGTPAMANLIREGKTHQLQNVIQTGRRLGMRTLDDHIEELLQRKIVTAEEAFDRCIAKERFVKHLSSVPEEWQEVLSKEKTEEAKAPAGAKTAARPAMAASR